MTQAGMARAATAEAPETTPPSADTAPAETPADASGIVVTGLRGVHLRSLTQSPAPVDVVQGSQITQAGRAEFGEALARLLPSINFVNNQAGVTSIVRPIVNRGLGPAYTLVLVNGKRRHNSAQITAGTGDNSGVNPTDFDLIPQGLVGQVEVLKDSAAAQYGSDAVAGVVNVKLRNADHGFGAQFTAGSLYQGQGELQSWKAQADAGFKLGDGGFLHISADGRHRGMAWWNFPATNGNFYGSATAPDAAAQAKNATWNRDGAHNGDPRIDAWDVAYNARLPISDTVALYSFGTYGQRLSAAGNNVRRENGQASFDSLFPNGYIPINNISENDWQFVLGADGDLSGWKWDLSTSYGRDRAHHFSELTINPSLGPNGPTSFGNLATYKFKEWVSNLDATKSYDIGLAKPLQVSFGAEYRYDTFRTVAGDPDGYRNGSYIYQSGDQFEDVNVGKYALVGAQSSFTIRPSEEALIHRGVLSGYGDIGLYPLRRWYIGVAGRVEHYSDASGTTVGGKFNSRFDFTSHFALRGTIGTGFRAPSLSQIAYAQTDNRTTILNGNIVPALSVLARNDSPLARALGATNLKPEKSVNFGFGAVWEINRDISITADAYQVTVKHHIIRTGNLYGANVRAALLANGYTGTEYVTYFTNAVDTRSRGLDVVINGRHNFDRFGKLDLTASFNWNKAVIQKIADTPGAIGSLDSGFYFFGRDRQGELSVGNPQTKLVLTANWALHPVNVNVQTTRYGELTYWRSQFSSQDLRYGAKWVTDIDIGVDVTRFAKLSVGAANVFNVRPDAAGPIDANTGVASLVYGPSPFAPSGGYYYGRVSVNF
ncbi:TonB-dependent receptor [Novosphingobium nitrogenifigens DSM 19370]|uniref:TonB-dependent receptor n=2 Tax=Novosphingobium nitrogenifigens TaxID=378548 RepID=F1ZBH1_9SPHN|nr:TonB-dependent receptor [Novosphingobium nitrogenifigens DSM 19370]